MTQQIREKKMPNINIRKEASMSVGELTQELLSKLGGHRENEVFVPKTDVWESNTGYHICISLPGLASDQVRIEQEEGFLVVSGVRGFNPQFQDEKIKLLESSYGRFQRRIKLNSKSDVNGIAANMENGLLYILIPKKQQQDYMPSEKAA